MTGPHAMQRAGSVCWMRVDCDGLRFTDALERLVSIYDIVWLAWVGLGDPESRTPYSRVCPAVWHA